MHDDPDQTKHLADVQRLRELAKELDDEQRHNFAASVRHAADLLHEDPALHGYAARAMLIMAENRG